MISTSTCSSSTASTSSSDVTSFIGEDGIVCDEENGINTQMLECQRLCGEQQRTNDLNEV